MNNAQKAFTYVNTFAPEICNITKKRFFLDIYTCSRNDRKNGTIERVIGETALLCNYPDLYRKDTKVNFRALNENACLSDFGNLNDLFTGLTASAETTAEIRKPFDSKHAHIFITAFKAFAESGHEDNEFGIFLEWFVNGGNETEINGTNWKTWNENKKSSIVENLGEGSFSFPQYRESEESMVTVSDIIMDVQRGITVHNMVENKFSYRIVYFVNEKGIGKNIMLIQSMTV